MIHQSLKLGISFKAIGKWIGKDHATVYREVENIKVQEPDCRRIDASGKEVSVEIVPFLIIAPFVRNPCLTRHCCRKPRRLYYVRKVQKECESLLGECRSGAALNKKQFLKMTASLSMATRTGSISATSAIPIN